MRKSFLLIVLASVFNGVSGTVMAEVTGLINLIGSRNQVIYMLAGILIGSFIFNFIGMFLSDRAKRSTEIALTSSAIIIIILYAFIYYHPVVTDFQVLFLSFLTFSINILTINLSVKAFDRGEQLFRRISVWIATGILTVFTVFVIAALYYFNGERGLQDFVICSEIIVLAAVIVLFSREFFKKRESSESA